MFTLKGLAILMAGAALAVAGCGGDDEGGGAGGGGENTPATLDVGVIPIVDVAPLYLGVEKGFFEEESLTIRPHLAQGGAAIIPAVQSGDFQIGFSNVVSEVLARSQGLPIQIVTQGVQAPENPEDDYSAVMVAEDSEIREPQDLEGKEIAVNTLKNIGDVTIKAALEKAGVDISRLRFVEVPFPDMIPTLEAGRVDGIWAIEPFLTQAREAGHRSIIANYAQLEPNLTVATYFAMQPYIEENGEVIDRFRRAMNRSLTYAQENPQEARDIVLEYTEVPRPVAQAMRLPFWSDDLNVPSIQLLTDLSERYGLVEEKPEMEELIYDG